MNTTWTLYDFRRASRIWSSLIGLTQPRRCSLIGGHLRLDDMLTSILPSKTGQKTWYGIENLALFSWEIQAVSRLLKACGKAIGKPIQVVLKLKRNEV